MREAASQINSIINAANQQVLGLTVKYFRKYAKVVIDSLVKAINPFNSVCE